MKNPAGNSAGFFYAAMNGWLYASGSVMSFWR
jgi:hypothetical protein